jgi:hypothetical protein
MPKFLVVRKGEGEGCDYTIGCNMEYHIIECASLEEAIRQSVDLCVFGEERKYCEENAIEVGGRDAETKELIMVPFDQCSVVELEPIRKAHNDKVALKMKELQEQADLEAFEKLKKKLGK